MVIFYFLLTLSLYYLLYGMNENSKGKIHQGRNIRFFRNAKNMKQEDFAERLGVSQPIVTRLEKQDVVDAAMLLKCAEILGVSADTLKEFDPETMFNNFTYHIDKIENTNGAISLSKDGVTPTNYNYPLEKLMEMHRENIELYERLLQAEKEKNAIFEKMLTLKNEA